MDYRSIGWVDYYTHFCGCADNYTDYALKAALRAGGLCFAAFEGERPAGVVCCRGNELLAVWVNPPFRGQGTGQALLSLCARALRERGETRLEARWIGASGLLERCGFARSSARMVYRCPLHPQNRARWQTLRKQRFEKPLSRLLREGYFVAPFCEKPPLLAGGFAPGFDPGLCGAPLEELLGAYSFAAWRKGEMTSFAAVTAAGRTGLVMRQLAVREDCRGTGAFLLPLAAAVDAAVDSSRTKLAFAVDRENRPMHNLAQRLFLPFSEQVSQQDVYVLPL